MEWWYDRQVLGAKDNGVPHWDGSRFPSMATVMPTHTEYLHIACT